MKKLSFILYILASTIIFSSCEKPIDVKPATAESELVIEAVITDQERPYTVKLSKSGSYFSPDEYPSVSGALVSIEDNQGYRVNLPEVAPGVYESALPIAAVSGRTYTLTVYAEGQTYTSSATMPAPVFIDSLGYEKSSGENSDNKYIASCYFYDKPETGHNYRFNFYKNGQLSKPHILVNDKYLNGNLIPVSFPGEKLSRGDTVTVELYGMDLAAYNYFNTIRQITGHGNNAAPENPVSNISNGALGYFGAFAVSSESIVIR